MLPAKNESDAELGAPCAGECGPDPSLDDALAPLPTLRRACPKASEAVTTRQLSAEAAALKRKQPRRSSCLFAHQPLLFSWSDYTTIATLHYTGALTCSSFRLASWLLCLPRK